VASAVAARLGGIVVNADAMQVYRELRILSARPSAEDEARVPHRLYGHVTASEVYSVARWLEDAGEALRAIWAQDRVAVVVGGTGLYFKALEEGLSPVPDIPDDIRTMWRNRLAASRAESLHGELAAVDPETARRLEPQDAQRIVRALEVHSATQTPLSAWQRAPGVGGLLDGADHVVRAVLNPDREMLYARCDQRFDAMIAKGAMDEVAALAALGLPPDLPAMKAIGVRELQGVLRGEATLEEAAAAAKTLTRRYAKRQMTWQRGNMMSWKDLSEQDLERNVAKILAFFSKTG